MKGIPVIEYHGKEQPFDLQSRLATVFPRMQLTTLLCIFLNVIFFPQNLLLMGRSTVLVRWICKDHSFAMEIKLCMIT